MRSLIWAFAVRICPKTRFHMARPKCHRLRNAVSICIKFCGSFYSLIRYIIWIWSSWLVVRVPTGWRHILLLLLNTCQEHKLWNESAHDKIYNKTCATSEDSDQPAHPRSLIRVFADCICLLQPPGYPKRDKREPLPYWVDVQADLSLCWSHMSYCRFCRALAQMLITLMLTFCK